MSITEIAMDDFVLRDFKKDGLNSWKPKEFLAKVNEILAEKTVQSLDGYAPFCRHLFIENFTEMPPGCVAINESNRGSINTAYEARREGELPVLTRWIRNGAAPRSPAKYLDLILYSRDQVLQEKAAFEGKKPEELESVDPLGWHLISVKAQDLGEEIPMMPATALRNSMIDDGGSGVPVDREYYAKCVSFWGDHCEVR